MRNAVIALRKIINVKVFAAFFPFVFLFSVGVKMYKFSLLCGRRDYKCLCSAKYRDKKECKAFWLSYLFCRLVLFEMEIFVEVYKA